MAALPAAGNNLTEHVETIGREIDRSLNRVEHGIEAATAVRLGSHRIDTGIRPPASGHRHQPVVDIVLREIDRLGAPSALGHSQTFGHLVDADDAPGAQ
jgi:hypothetical protein